MTRNLLIAASAAVALLAAGFGVQTWRLDRVKARLTETEMALTARTAERDRWIAQARDNADAAVEDARAAAEACSARVAEARRSSSAIRDLLNQEAPRDPQGCPVRALLPADGVRQAIGAPAG